MPANADVIDPEPMPQPKRRVVRIKGKAQGMRGINAADRANVVAIGDANYKALELIAKRGLTQRDAAAEAGIGEGALSRLLAKPEARDLLAEMQETQLRVLRSKALCRTEVLLDEARSERVRLEAARLVLEQSKPEAVAAAGSVELVIDLGS